MDSRGYCRIEGRIKEMIIRSGENIYPREIEAVLLSHPAVTAAAVVGIADRFWGEVVGAAISTSAAAPPTEAELAGFCRARLAAYKVPVRWLFTSAFPLTTTGKGAARLEQRYGSRRQEGTERVGSHFCPLRCAGCARPAVPRHRPEPAPARCSRAWSWVIPAVLRRTGLAAWLPMARPRTR